MKQTTTVVGVVVLAIVFYLLTSSRTEVKKEKSCGCNKTM
jgi:hypothetical protein